jgi:uncharacterized membrane protein YbhN (UPF0104 family)
VEHVHPGLRPAPLLKGAAAVVALGVLVHTLRSADLARAAALVARSGGWVAVGLVPYAVALAFDGLAWRLLVAPIARPPLVALVRARLRCDALGATLPGGTLVGESIAPTWLREWMPVDAGVAAIAARKCMVGVAEGIYLVGSFAIGFAVLAARAPAMPWVVLALGALMLAMFGGMGVALASGSIAARAHRWLASLPIPPLRRWIDSRARGFASTDARLAALFRARPSRLAATCALSLASWSTETLETWVLLRLVGIQLPIATVLAFEASVSLLRSLGAFSPGGLGVQDVGYVAALGALGVPDAVTAGAAFIVLKRAKEMAWTLIGYASFLSPDARKLPMVRGAMARVTLREARS